MLQRLSIFIFLNCICCCVHAQLGIEDFSVSDDGKNIFWSNYDTHNNICFAQVDSLLNSFSYSPKQTKISVGFSRISGNGKQVYFMTGKELKVADLTKDSLTNEKTICKQTMYTSVFDVTSDGNNIIFGYPIKGNSGCSPGNQRMLYIKKENGEYKVIDTLGSKAECSMVYIANIGKGGTVFWQDLQFRIDNKTTSHIAIDSPGKTPTEISPTIPPGCQKKFYFTSSNSTNLFLLSVDTNNNKPNAFYFYKKTANGYSDPQLLNFIPSLFFLAGSFAISPDGNKICWVELSTERDNNGTPFESVHSCRYENGKWSEPEKLFDVPTQFGFTGVNGGYHRLVISDSSIFCLGGDSHVLLYTNFDQSGKLYGLDLRYQYTITNYGTNGVSRLNISEPIAAGELIHLQFPLKNTSGNTMIMTVPNTFNEHYKMQKPIPRDKKGWDYVAVDFTSIWATENIASTEIQLAPGDSMLLDYYTKFQYCRQLMNTSLYDRGNNKGVILIAQSGKVELNKFRNETGELLFKNGKPMEDLSKTSSGGYHFIRWFENGDTCMDVYFDKDRKKTGEWKLYSEEGNLIYELDFKKSEKIITTKTFYANGFKKSQMTKKKSCAIKYAYTWYNDGKLKSKAKFRSVKNLEVYHPKLAFVTYKSTSAKYYYEYYSNGQKKLEVFQKRNGKKRGTWKSYYENGNICGVRHYRNDKEVGIFSVRTITGDCEYEYDYRTHTFICGSFISFNDFMQNLPPLNFSDFHESYRGSYDGGMF
jgi:antitoxin component YwqK of YwqJK toxin-antitoxin module